MELNPTPSPPAPPQEQPANIEPEKEDDQEAIASEKDEPETGVQTRQGPSPLVTIVTPSRVPVQCSYFTGKRKADADADPKREKKMSREISEPLEESEPEPGEDVLGLLMGPAEYSN